MGRGSGFEGLWLDEHRIQPELRQIDKFLEYIRKHLGSSSLAGISVDSKDRIVRIDYYKWGHTNSFYFFFKARNLYFANRYFDKKDGHQYVFKSWLNKKDFFQNEDFDIFDEVGRTQLKEHSSDENKVIEVKSLLQQEFKKANLKSVEGKSKKFFKRKIKNIKTDLSQVRKWPQILDYINENVDLSVKERIISIDGVKIKFKLKEHFHRRDELFTKIKKFKKAITILELRLSDTENKLVKFGSQDIKKSTLPVVSPVWKLGKNENTVTVEIKSEYRVIQFENFKLGIGTTAKGNDQLRKEWASKNDMWFHLDGDKSAHIILKEDSGVLDQDKLSIIAAVMIEYSKLNYSSANLIYTQVKNLKGVKGVPGKVNYKKEKRIQVDCATNWASFKL